MAGRVAAALIVAFLLGALPASAADPPTPWDGANPFHCVLQQAGFGARVPNPGADPFCVEFDKRRQNVLGLGVVDFFLHEPARVAAASDKCFYFQSDHWRGSLVQDIPATKTYEWDGHYFFDKARGEGGVWVSNFNVNGKTGDPGDIPGLPAEYARQFGPGTGGLRTHNGFEAEPRCVALARRAGDRIYTKASGSRCAPGAGAVTRRRLGRVRLGASEASVRRSLGRPGEVKRGFLRWCAAGGGRYLVGEREDRSGELGEGSSERAVALIASARGYRHRGVGPGSSVRSLRRKLRRARRVVRYGATVVFVARPRSRVLLGVRRGRVRFVVLRDRRVLRGRSSIRTFLLRAR